MALAGEQTRHDMAAIPTTCTHTHKEPVHPPVDTRMHLSLCLSTCHTDFQLRFGFPATNKNRTQ